jgi:hypothetical protein
MTRKIILFPISIIIFTRFIEQEYIFFAGFFSKNMKDKNHKSLNLIQTTMELSEILDQT